MSQQKKISVAIKGGLGNQLFQYAFAKSLKQEGYEVSLNTSFYENTGSYTKRRLSLLDFAIDSSLHHVTKLESPSFFSKIIFNLDVDSRTRYTTFYKNFFTHSYSLAGFFQSELFFKNIREGLIKEITLVHESQTFKEMEAKIVRSKNSLIVHARRGDYLSSSGYTILTKSYYQKALELFDGDYEIFAFSDDPVWLENALERKVTIVSGKGFSDVEELLLMSKGQNFIIANSTFSWWAAWLSVSVNKKVVAPKNWFTSALWWRANRDIVPNEWTRIDEK